eukprot:SAG25_NODE_12017_length_289_cov_1.321053_1_plen_47_part_01
MDPGKGGFDSVPPESLDWAYRRERLLEEMLRHEGGAPDIIAVEELDH